ncbi:putative Ig domain-containing protein, partial [Buttiauxella brennerae]|uniref:putative Ig domain-containing protein n=1 Tax=Buttiauxella brennerae TaxID=82988 RepID=UPI00286F6EE0
LSVLEFNDLTLSGEDIKNVLESLKAPEAKGSLKPLEVSNDGQTWSWVMPDDAFDGSSVNARAMSKIYKELLDSGDERALRILPESIGRLSKDENGRYYDSIQFSDGSMLHRYFDASLTYVEEIVSRNDADKALSLTYSAVLADGSSLPEWLTIDPNTGTIKSSETTEEGRYTLLVTVTNHFGKTATQELNINLTKATTNHEGTDQNDLIKTGLLDDTIYGQAGDDIIYSDYNRQFDDTYNQGIYPHSRYGNDTVYGGAGNDIIYSGYGNNYLDGGDGDDKITGTGTLIGGSGNDILIGSGVLKGGVGDDFIEGASGAVAIHFDLNDGHDTIDSTNLTDGFISGNKIVFGVGITADMIQLNINGNNLNIQIGTGQDKLTLLDYVNNQSITTIEFADGTIWSDFRDQLTFEIIGTDQDDSLSGSNFNDYIYAGDGDDYISDYKGESYVNAGSGNDYISITHGTVIGGTGNDIIELNGVEVRGDGWGWFPTKQQSTLIFNLGDGSDEVWTPGSATAGKNIIKFGSNITANMISVVQSEQNKDDLIIKINNQGDQITLKNYLTQTGGLHYQLEFADGTILEDMRELIKITLIGTAGNDDIMGTSINDIIYSGAGDDDIYDVFGKSEIDAGVGDDNITLGYGTVKGGAGNDSILIYGNRQNYIADEELEFKATTILFNLGDGQDEIWERSTRKKDSEGNHSIHGGNHALSFGEGITAEMLSFEEQPGLYDGEVDLVIKIGTSGDQIILREYYNTSESSNSHTPASYQLKFTDGTVFDLQHVLEFGAGADPLQNKAPEIQEQQRDLNFNEKSPFSIVLPENLFSDPDGDELAFSITLADGSALPSWLTYNATTRTLSGTPQNDQVGDLNFKITATDPKGLSISQDFKLTVNNVNDAPIAHGSLSEQILKEGEAWQFALPSGSFTDIDKNDVLTYSLKMTDGSAIPSWLKINTQTGLISGVPAGINNLNLIIVATDKAGSQATHKFNVKVVNNQDVIYGTSGNDNITGKTGDTIIYGGAGNDTITDNSGDNTIYGGAGNDTITGNGTIIGGTGNDWINATVVGSDDTFLFDLGDGQDTIINRGGVDKIIFGEGITSDMISYRKDSTTLYIVVGDKGDQILLSNYFDTGTYGNGQNIYQTIKRFEFADGTVWEDIRQKTLTQYYPDTTNTITGTPWDDIIYAGSGNDTITDNSGNNTIYGGAGNDTITGKGTIIGGKGNDWVNATVVGSDDTFLFNLGDGQDTIINRGG